MGICVPHCAQETICSVRKESPSRRLRLALPVAELIAPLNIRYKTKATSKNSSNLAKRISRTGRRWSHYSQPHAVVRPVVGRGERIRTSDSCVPNAVLYQAELHPEWCSGLTNVLAILLPLQRACRAEMPSAMVSARLCKDNLCQRNGI